MRKHSEDPILNSAYPNSRELSKRQEEILRKTLHIFAVKGYRAATIEDIANELDFTQAALYHYFDSKQEMLTILVLRPTELLLSAIASVRNKPLDATDKIRLAVREHIRVISENSDLFRVMIREQVELASESLIELKRLNRRYHEEFTALINQGVESGEVSTKNPNIASLFVIGGLNWILQWYNPEGKLSPNDVAALYEDLVLTGIRAR